MKKKYFRTYRSWTSAIQRCHNPNNSSFPVYGARGISVCDKWRNSFAAFLADMGERPTGATLDRWPDGKGNYEPGNCRWATKREQTLNRSNVYTVMWGGTPHSVREISEITGISYHYVILAFHEDRIRGESETIVDRSGNNIAPGVQPPEHRRKILTAEQIGEIRRLRGIEKQKVLAQRFGVSAKHISRIQCGSHRYVPGRIKITRGTSDEPCPAVMD
jgi:hypothetical protein